MKTTISTSSENKKVKFINNGFEIIVFAMQGCDVWFEIGDGFDTMEEAINTARKEMLKYGYAMNEDELKEIA